MLNVETVLWDLPMSEHAAWRAAGFGTISYAQYHAELDAALARAYAEGRPVTLLPAKVAEVSQQLRELEAAGLTPALPHALLALYGRRQLNEPADRSSKARRAAMTIPACKPV